MSRPHSARNKGPKMIGAHVPRPVRRTSRRGVSTADLSAIGDAYDTWAQTQGRTHLHRVRAAFNP